MILPSNVTTIAINANNRQEGVRIADLFWSYAYYNMVGGFLFLSNYFYFHMLYLSAGCHGYVYPWRHHDWWFLDVSMLSRRTQKVCFTTKVGDFEMFYAGIVTLHNDCDKNFDLYMYHTSNQ